MAREAGWEHLWHMADIGVHGWGPTLSAAFEQGALGLTAVTTDPDRIQPVQEISIECREPDRELLFLEWLNSLVYEMSIRKMLFGRYSVQIKEGGLTAQAWGEPVDIARHEPAVEVKGATVTCLEVSQDPDGTWHARCVVDV